MESAEVDDGRLKVRALIAEPGAVIKTAAGVYCGLAVSIFNGRIDHVALVDAPGVDAGKTAALLLSLSEEIRKVNFTNTPAAVRRAVADLSGPDGPLLNKTEARRQLIEAIDRKQHEDRRRPARPHDFSRPDDQAAAMAIIRAARSAPSPFPWAPRG